LGVSGRWLEDSARAEIVPHYKVGRFLRFRVSEIASRLVTSRMLDMLERSGFYGAFTVTVFLRRIALVVCRHASTGLDGTGWPSQVRLGRLRLPFFVGV
jgi:hypothetical protein